MPELPIRLRGITWNHTRGFVPLVAAAQRFEELSQAAGIPVSIAWEKRSLQEFADQPLQPLAESFDLLVIDHPWAGFAARHGVLNPLERILPGDFLADQKANSVGVSHASYRFEGQQWALAIDAATPVASWRPDLMRQKDLAIPNTWEDVMALAKLGLVAMPGIPQDTLMNFYMLCCVPDSDLFVSEDCVVNDELGMQALEQLRELASYQSSEIFEWNPIQVYEAMSRRDDIAYCPFAYGYSNYSRRGYAPNLLYFGDVVSKDGYPLRTTLGGTGLAISSHCKHPEVAAQFAQMVAGRDYQQTQFAENGGQPGHRAAWEDEENNRRTKNYFANTLPCLDRAYLRPRYSGSLQFQDRDGGGAPIRDYMMHGGDPKQVMQTLNQMYRDSRKDGAE
ncbi:multiple sugar transport system substrate-binding protein [Rhodopirellula rubra]|uniref:Multiple sugar transport system substrate-binding protein n=1 Tax=Aporhodopirellula rubra TaxID=980271 RepID=A0A7W5H869_9BACT|nr:extracellular solute-binding protein [Aporhodopirellula rubra]MBB3210382.1 multiple sugar transport system substrate-binding protein [Aporhodopirellula rubra]